MTRVALRVGLTGGVASGKSAVAVRLIALGVRILDADDVARELVAPGAPALEAILDAFGERFRRADGTLDRPALRTHIFDNASARLELESILHPRIRALLERRASTPAPAGEVEIGRDIAAASGCGERHVSYVVVAVPLLAEVGGYPWLDAVIVVDVPRELQHSRLLARDGVDETLANKMLDAQASREQRLAIADYVIDNSGTLSDLDRAVDDLHAQLCARAAQQSQTPLMPATPKAPSPRT